MQLNQNKKIAGFSLLEVLIALFVLGLILNLATTGLSGLQLNKQLKANDNQLESIHQALLSHVVINGFLPCPDNPANSNGTESRNATTGRCEVSRGYIPYLDLDGIGRVDAFGNPFLYDINTDVVNNNIFSACNSASVFARSDMGGANPPQHHFICPSPYRQFCGTVSSTTEAACNNLTGYVSACSSPCIVQNRSNDEPFFNRLTPPIGYLTALNGTLRVCNQNPAQCTNATSLGTNVIANQVPVVFGSYGRNGAQTWANCNNANPKERENCDGDRYFQVHPFADDYDDQLRWISMQQIKAVMQNRIDWHLPFLIQPWWLKLS
jgi:prepilin-type N-terminal cleavage/methylation domain-containing protein